MHPDVSYLIAAALSEDEAGNDVSGTIALSPGQSADATVVAKQSGVLSGYRLASAVCDAVGGLVLEPDFEDGDRVERGTPIARLTGDGRSLLRAERTMLNLLGRMSAVATLTGEYVAAVDGTGTIIKDTRKTTPLWRAWERRAVVDGGGVNHRDTLASMVMFKENHLRCAGGIRAAATLAREAGVELFEVEVTDLDEFAEALDVEAPRIMLDNFSLDDTRAAVALNRGATLEASGNMTLDRIRSVAECGVDEISVGALTHSAPIFDLSLLVDWR